MGPGQWGGEVLGGVDSAVPTSWTGLARHGHGLTQGLAPEGTYACEMCASAHRHVSIYVPASPKYVPPVMRVRVPPVYVRLCVLCVCVPVCMPAVCACVHRHVSICSACV